LRSSERINEIAARVALAADTVMKRESAKLESLEGMVGVLSPENTLRRGYSITSVNGKAVTDASTLPKGTKISTRLHIGTVESEII
ncbi:MAG: exodeoxyribonuclease VII large subunit, partial [Muribaculaceae bacterium]|nr:exodeoxyribonuclease VII large subunit [Muribaculaceae bacterium]